MKKINKKRLIKLILAIFGIPFLIFCDIYEANLNQYNYRSFSRNSESKALMSDPTNVAIVTSDDPSLQNPSSREAYPSDETVEQMVRRAVSLAGGFPKITSGMTVLIKPNLVEIQQPSGSGNDTDVRVVEAVAKIVDEIDHGKIKIVVGDGSPRTYTSFEVAAAGGSSPQWKQLYGDSDPAKDAGYQKLLSRMIAAGVDFRISNLNGNSPINPWPELDTVKIPGGGVAQPQKGTYRIHHDVLKADAYITVPVLKIHDPGITCALKNQIGLAPSTLYGFSKTAGVPQNNRAYKLLHTSQAPYNWTDKEIVDLCTIAKIKYAVVDALMCLEIQKTVKSDKSNQVRMNTIVAGEDPVAVDNVCARLVGLNPDDIEHITLAERVGLGTNNPDKINIVGADLSGAVKRFKKNVTIPDQIFGQSNRDWILSNTYSTDGISDPINYEFIPNESSLSPSPGKDGWSEGLYFINDRINLKDYYTANGINTNSVIAYAAAYFNSPADQEAELWTGSDEAMKIYVNGTEVYSFNGLRTFSNSMIWIDPVTKILIRKGMNRILVKTVQRLNSSYFDFSFNICEVESNPLFRGNRVTGLKFSTDPKATYVAGNGSSLISTEFSLENCYPNPFNPSTTISYSISQSAPVKLEIFDINGRSVALLVNKHQNPGNYRADFNATRLTSGVYFYRLSTQNHYISKKMLLIK